MLSPKVYSCPGGVLLAKKTLSNHRDKLLRLYEQAASNDAVKVYIKRWGICRGRPQRTRKSNRDQPSHPRESRHHRPPPTRQQRDGGGLGAMGNRPSIYGQNGTDHIDARTALCGPLNDHWK